MPHTEVHTQHARTEAIVLSAGFANPLPEPSVVHANLSSAATVVIAADSGLVLADDHLPAVDLIIGDLDSAPASLIDRAEQAGAEVQRFPAAKDATDLELALQAAADRGVTHVTVLAGAGGRVDHAVVALHVLSNPCWPFQVSGWLGHDRFWVIHDVRELDMAANTTLTLAPVGGPATVTTQGMRWELSDGVLDAFAGRGLSNVTERANPTINVHAGTVLAIAPAVV